MESRKITLAAKPGASLAIGTYTPADPAKLPAPLDKTLVVFLNGMAAPQTSWRATIDLLLEKSATDPVPALLTYDRYGQLGGASDPDPSDPPDTPYGHDLNAVVADMHEVITQVISSSFPHLPGSASRLVFVANSIGCPLARLYASAHPGTVGGFVLLDSMLANSDFVSVIPDPDAPGFDLSSQPEGVTVDALRHARQMMMKVFYPTVPNAERIDRRNIPELLPLADGPVLPAGPDGRPPLVTVAGHDFERFARENEEGMMKIAPPVTNGYTNPVWHEYNRGLARLATREESSREPIIAEGCGHVIQKDSPPFVAAELTKMLKQLIAASSSASA